MKKTQYSKGPNRKYGCSGNGEIALSAPKLGLPSGKYAIVLNIKTIESSIRAQRKRETQRAQGKIAKTILDELLPSFHTSPSE